MLFSPDRVSENARFVTLDLCDPYKRFAQEHFPNAQLVAQKFHVLRLLQPAGHQIVKLMPLPFVTELAVGRDLCDRIELPEY